jgi:hypothetical protein
MIKLPWRWENDEEDMPPWMKIDDRRWFPTTLDSPSIRHWLVPRAPDQKHSLIIFYSDVAFIDGSPFNRSVQRLMGVRCPWPYANNLLALRTEVRNRYDDPSYSYRDAQISDVPAIVDYLVEYGNRCWRCVKLSSFVSI